MTATCHCWQERGESCPVCKPGARKIRRRCHYTWERKIRGARYTMGSRRCKRITGHKKRLLRRPQVHAEELMFVPDPKLHLMMCSRCRHLNEVTNAVCEECGYDAGIPVFRDRAEESRALFDRLLPRDGGSS